MIPLTPNVELLEEFMDYLRLHQFSKPSINNYVFLVAKFLEKNLNFREANYQHIVDYLSIPQIKSRSLSYRNSILAAIKRYYDFLIFKKIRSNHPCNRLFINSPINQDKIILFDVLSSSECNTPLILNHWFGFLS